MAAPNTSFSDSLIATAIARWTSDTLFDQIFDKTATLDWLKKNQKAVPDGLAINEPLQYAQSTTAGAFSKGGTFAPSDREIATVAQYDWRYYGDSIAIYPMDLMKATGDSAKVNLLEAKMNNVERSLLDAINADLWKTSWSSTGNKFIPLPVMIDATSSIGGINSTTYDWWQGRVEATGEALSTSRMANTYNSCSLGRAGDYPDLIVTTQTLFEAYGEIMLPYYHINATPAGASPTGSSLGFPKLRFMQSDVVFDENCPSTDVFFLNSSYLKFRPHTLCAGKFLLWEGKPNDQIANTRIAWIMFALTCSRRSALGKQTTKTAP